MNRILPGLLAGCAIGAGATLLVTHDSGPERRDIRIDEPIACSAAEDALIVDCRDGTRLDYHDNEWWPTGEWANK